MFGSQGKYEARHNSGLYWTDLGGKGPPGIYDNLLPSWTTRAPVGVAIPQITMTFLLMLPRVLGHFRPRTRMAIR